MSDYPEIVPGVIRAGDNLEFAYKCYDTVGTELLTGNSYTAYFVLSNSSDAYSFSSVTMNTQGYVFAVPYATTSGWTAADYSTQIYCEDGTNRYPQTSGYLTVNPALTSAVDGRSDYRTIRDALNAQILGTATAGQQAMSIAGRSIQRMSLEELMNAFDKFDAKVKSEEAQQDISEGKSPKNTISTKFRGYK